MAFVKREIKDRVVQYPRRYQLVEVSQGIYDLVPVTGTVTEEGTAINKAYLQPIEDALEEAVTKEELNSHLADIASQEAGKGASMIGIHDANGNFTATDVEGALAELFTSVSDGKTEIATAITDVDPTKTPSGSDTFSQLATAIRGISTGKKWASGSQSFTSSNEKISVRGLDFRPGVIVLSWYNYGYGTYRAIYSYSPSIPYKILRYDDYVYSSKNLSLFDDGFEAEMLLSGTGTSRTASWLAIE